MSAVHLIVLFSLVSVTFAATIPLHNGPPACDPNTGIGCMPSSNDCPETCTCNRTDVEIDDTETESPTRPIKKVEYKFVRTITNYESSGISSDENDSAVEDNITNTRSIVLVGSLQSTFQKTGKFHEKVQYVFRGVIASAILFIACACACVMSVCVYCCHVRQSDRKLKKDLNALAKKLKVDVKQKAGPSRKLSLDPKGESCNVIVQDANVMCV